VKSLKILWRVAADELAAWCHTSATQDYNTVLSRTEHEGESFLTITLPAFAKDFERSLDAGQVDSNSFAGFHLQRKGPLPRFLGGFLNQVFDPRTGRLLDQPNIDCIFAVRQLTMMFGKILLPCSDERVEDAIKGYIECEKEVARIAKIDAPELYSQFRRVATLLFGDCFSHVENQLHNGEIRPKHGPGATADGLRGNSKFDQREWPIRLEKLFPFGDYIFPNWRYASESLGDVHFLEPGAERPVKVITVPKTLKTPRIIAVEPTCMQYMQQALCREFVVSFESDRVGKNSRRNLIEGQIGFSDQVPNRLLAAEGSLTGELATLDLSEASDRVSIGHVENLLCNWPLLREVVMATRSSKAQVPGWGVITLSKFASMGSALTFPIEAAVFLTAVYMGIENGLNRRITRKDVESHSGRVRVYGDDIIVPVDSVCSVNQVLELLGFKVNTGKSYWNGKFRESCGGDYYDGVDVTPVRVRRDLPSSLTDAQGVMSLVALRNLFYLQGMWETTKWLDDRIGRLFPRGFPIVEPTSPLLGRTSFLGYQAERVCSELHRPLVRGYVAIPRTPNSKLDGVGALLKWFLKEGEEPFIDPNHLERQGRPLIVDIKSRWMPPY